MASDGAVIGAVPPDPAAAGIGRIKKVQTVPRYIGPIEGKPCGQNTLGGRLTIDGPVGHRRKLNAVLAVKYDVPDGIGEPAAGYPVENDVSHSYLSPQAFAPAFGVDNPAEPIEIILRMLRRRGRRHRNGTAPVYKGDVGPQQVCQRTQRHVCTAGPYQRCSAEIKCKAVGKDVVLLGRDPQAE